MIDSGKAYYHITDHLLEALEDGDYLHSKGIKLYGGNRFYLPHPFGQENPMVRISWKKRTLCLETSLPKLLQGHNVFGSNRVQDMCLAALGVIYRYLDVPFDKTERRIVKGKRIRLGRVDFNCSFRMESQHEVAQSIEEIHAQMWAEGRPWTVYGRDDAESVYHRQHSKRVTEKFYNKYLELLVNKIPDAVEHKDIILGYALGLLRFEVTFRDKELKRLKLKYADQWTPALVRDTLLYRLGKLRLEGSIKKHLAAREIVGLNKGGRAFYGLWSQGADLGQYRDYSTLRRVRDEIREHGVDIFRQRELGGDVDLEDLLTEDNAYFVGPKGLVKRGAILIPGGRSV